MDIFTYFGTFGVFSFFFLLFIRFVPLMAIAEIKAVTPQADAQAHAFGQLPPYTKPYPEGQKPED